MNVSVSAGVGMYLYIDKFIVIGITHYNCFIECLNILVYLCMYACRDRSSASAMRNTSLTLHQFVL